MSRFGNVKTLLNVAEYYDPAMLSKILQWKELDELDELAEDIAFVLISMWAMVPEDKKQTFIDRLTDEIVNVEIKEMFPSEEE